MRFGGFWVGNADFEQDTYKLILAWLPSKTKLVLVRVGNDCNAERDDVVLVDLGGYMNLNP